MDVKPCSSQPMLLAHAAGNALPWGDLFCSCGGRLMVAVAPDSWRFRQKFTLWLFNIAMGNGPFMDGLPIKNRDFPCLC
jgi:hypothetical protein